MNDNEENKGTEEVDDFAASFAEAIAADTDNDAPKEETTTVETKTEEETTPTVDETKEETTTAETKTEEVATPAAATEETTTVATPAATEVKPTPAPAVVKQPDPAPVAKQEAPSVDDEFPDPVMSADDVKSMEAFRKDWPDVAPVMDKMLEHTVARLEAKYARALSTLATQIYDDMAPIYGSHVKTEQVTLRQAVLTAHSDFDAHYPHLKPWIEKQPTYLRKGMEEAYTKGNAEEIVDLVQRYKDANGVKPQVQGSTKTEKPAVSASKVAALTPVSSKRTVVSTKSADPNDYDSAFDEAVQG